MDARHDALQARCQEQAKQIEFWQEEARKMSLAKHECESVVAKQAESIAYLQERWQGQSATILEQAAYITRLEACLMDFMTGQGCTDAEAREDLEAIKRGD